MRVVTYEDRPADTIGLKLLVLSLNRHCPGVPVDVIFPSAPPNLERWLSLQKDIRLHAGSELKQTGYDVKPSVLSHLLDQGVAEAVWIDTDIIVTKDFRPFLAATPRDHLIVTTEWFGAPYQGGSYRSRAWGLPVGRELRATTNTAVVRVTQDHVGLLGAWNDLLHNEDYAASQKRPWHDRPIHFQSDQEVLSALLESEQFASVPICYLQRGRDIAHCFQHQGYALHQMLANFLTRNKPYFVHGQGAKPWREDDKFRVHLDTSPYTLCAAEYRHGIDEDMAWLQPKSRAGMKYRRMFRDDQWLTGLPLAMYNELTKQRVPRTLLKRLLGKP